MAKDKSIKIQHIAFVMDANRRWARKHGLPISKGHEEGAKTLKKILDYCLKKGIKIVTVYALSLDNLRKRSKNELKVHFDLHKKYIKEEILDSDRFERDQIKFNVLGRTELLPKDEQLLINKAVEKTKRFTKRIFNVCVAYDGRDEIVQAVKKIINKDINPNNLSMDIIKQNLYTSDIPPPDLVIRTGMNPERRLSGFLLWDSAYTEMIFKKTYWPSYTAAILRNDLINYSKHKRRFGR